MKTDHASFVTQWIQFNSTLSLNAMCRHTCQRKERYGFPQMVQGGGGGGGGHIGTYMAYNKHNTRIWHFDSCVTHTHTRPSSVQGTFFLNSPIVGAGHELFLDLGVPAATIQHGRVPLGKTKGMEPCKPTVTPAHNVSTKTLAIYSFLASTWLVDVGGTAVVK